MLRHRPSSASPARSAAALPVTVPLGVTGGGVTIMTSTSTAKARPASASDATIRAKHGATAAATFPRSNTSTGPHIIRSSPDGLHLLGAVHELRVMPPRNAPPVMPGIVASGGVIGCVASNMSSPGSKAWERHVDEANRRPALGSTDFYYCDDAVPLPFTPPSSPTKTAAVPHGASRRPTSASSSPARRSSGVKGSHAPIFADLATTLANTRKHYPDQPLAAESRIVAYVQSNLEAISTDAATSVDDTVDTAAAAGAERSKSMQGEPAAHSAPAVADENPHMRWFRENEPPAPRPSDNWATETSRALIGAALGGTALGSAADSKHRRSRQACEWQLARIRGSFPSSLPVPHNSDPMAAVVAPSAPPSKAAQLRKAAAATGKNGSSRGSRATRVVRAADGRRLHLGVSTSSSTPDVPPCSVGASAPSQSTGRAGSNVANLMAWPSQVSHVPHVTKRANAAAEVVTFAMGTSSINNLIAFSQRRRHSSSSAGMLRDEAGLLLGPSAGHASQPRTTQRQRDARATQRVRMIMSSGR